ncbi:MAG: ABC transporter ATP-binding protein [Fastidiosipilaceae bacterium]|jgi:branched-chain amino acid transport system ATP-binding protein
MLLQIEDLNVYYGAIHAVKNISFKVSEGEIVTMIGANGAGKTTILQSISSLLPVKSGSITFDGKEIANKPAYKIVKGGLSQVPEGRRIFTELTVRENLEMGAFTRADRLGVQEDIKKMYTRFPRLEERKNQGGGTLSGGEQQMLSIARALMARPRLLLLDEPSMGLSPLLVQEIFRIIRDVNEDGTTVLLVEQNAQLALSVADRGYVLETGRVTMSGQAKYLLGDERIQEAYLGGKKV